MNRLLYIGIDTFSALLILLPVILIFKFSFFQQYSVKRTTVIGLFALYLSAVFSATGIPDVNSLTPDFSFNLIPFIDIANDPAGYLKNSLLNILLFVPFGFLLPAVWRKYRTLKKTALAGFAFSLIIELLQIFTFRLTDVDDLITNTAGALAGYFLAKICLGKVWQKPLEWEEQTDGKYEPILVFAVVLFLMFFIHPSVSNVLYRFYNFS